MTNVNIIAWRLFSLLGCDRCDVTRVTSIVQVAPCLCLGLSPFQRSTYQDFGIGQSYSISPNEPKPTEDFRYWASFFDRRNFRYNSVGTRLLSEPSHHGMWSFKRKDTMMKLYWNTANRTYSRRTLVVGGFAATILLEGEVAEHEDGYRSEKITILGVYSPDNASHRRSLAHHLGLPYVKVPRIQDAPNEFPRIYSYT